MLLEDNGVGCDMGFIYRGESEVRLTMWGLLKY